MGLKQTIQEELKKSLQERNEIVLGTMRMVLAAINNKEIEKRTKASKELPHATEADLQKKSVLSDEEIQQVIAGEVKKHKESIEMFQKGNRQDLVDKETRELEVLQKYLPAQLSEDEIRAMVKDAISKTGAASQKDIGKVMAVVVPQTKGRADGATVSNIVKEILS